MAGSRLARALSKLALLLAGTAIACVVAETAARVLGLAPEVGVVSFGRYRLSSNPKIVYEPIPGYRPPVRRDRAFIDYWEGNRLGYRDREHLVAKPEGVFRIAVIGDSLAAGYRIDRIDRIFPFLVERQLELAGHRVEVLNFAVPGYETEQEVETLRTRALAYDPDLVLVAYCLDDRSRKSGMHLPALLRRQRRTGILNELELAPILIRSHSYRAFYFHGWRRLVSPAESRDAPDRVPSAFEALAGLQREHDFAVLVAIFPSLEAYESYGNSAEHAFVHSLADTHGFEVLDLLAAFDACSDGRGETLRVDSNDVGHFDARGHACAASAIARYVERSHELPAR